jgi:hypothetical protein
MLEGPKPEGGAPNGALVLDPDDTDGGSWPPVVRAWKG